MTVDAGLGLHVAIGTDEPLEFKSPAHELSWTCDAEYHRVVIRFDNGAEHTLTMDFVERLLFGSDQDGAAIRYNRTR